MKCNERKFHQVIYYNDIHTEEAKREPSHLIIFNCQNEKEKKGNSKSKFRSILVRVFKYKNSTIPNMIMVGKVNVP